LVDRRLVTVWTREIMAAVVEIGRTESKLVGKLESTVKGALTV